MPKEARSVAAEQLYTDVCELFLSANTAEGAYAMLDFVEAQWQANAARVPGPHDAEVCRLAMLASVTLEDYGATPLWRTRALARFAAIGWTEGAATIIMSEAFVELARVNKGYPTGRTLDVLKPSPVALAAFDELDRFATGPASGFQLGPGSPSQPVLRRLIREKRGFLLLLQRDLPGARRSYEMALDAAGSHRRGQVKVQLGRLLVDYLAADDVLARRRFADETETLGGEASAAASADIAKIAEHNAAIMRRSGPDLLPYEIL